MKSRAGWGVWASRVALGIGITSAGIAMAQTSATPNPQTLPVPTQTNPAGTTGGTNTATPPSDPTPPASAHPAPPPTATAPNGGKAQSSDNPGTSQQTSPTGDRPGAQQTSPTGGANQAIKDQGTSGATVPKTPGSTTPGAAEAGGKSTLPQSSEGGVGSLNEGGLTSDQLHERIDNALRNEPTLSGSNLTVNVGDDSIDVTGTATSNKERVTARRIVQSFAGNRRVRERITVRGGGVSNAAPAITGSKPEEKSQAEDKEQQKPKGDPAKLGDRSGDPRGSF
ncbi:MAG: hypothetical protein JWO13_215 [Acidobacteriales bacterium]|nr:hypothetical protein [Terriglobales bacterium]